LSNDKRNDALDTIYMDYNATTPIREEVLGVMNQVARQCYGNPSSAHLPGRMSKACVEDARRKVAESLGAEPSEICFTNGGSESVNLAIKGSAATRKSGHIITVCIEHSAVRNSCFYLAEQGFEVTCLAVDRGGHVDPRTVEGAIRPDTFLVTVMWANNEAGQIQPVQEIAQITRSRNILFHTDAVQAFGKVPVSVKDVPVDLLSISGHKFYAPKGIGALYIRSGVELVPQVHGGGQEMRRRSGTENVVGAAAMGEACVLAVRDLEGIMPGLAKLRDNLEEGILTKVPDTRVSGDSSRRVPNTTNISFRGVEAGMLLRKLDEYGFAVSGASACASGANEPSTVLMNGMGLSREEAIGAVRLSLGRFSEESHVTKLLEVLPGVVRDLRTGC
jgi:cysteine desulfurase